MAPRLLLLETSTSTGLVALAEGERLLEARTLDEARRHARDLAPTVAALLAAHGWKPRDVSAVVIGRGPGSYTGLRVGLMSAKAFAYATECAVIALDTFGVIAQQAPEEARTVDVLADAQQDKVYVQSFQREDDGFAVVGPLAIRPIAAWLADLPPAAWLTGPGLRKHRSRLPENRMVVGEDAWSPRPETLVRLGLAKYEGGELTDLWTLEPLYLRPSSAEEQWANRAKP